jgi:hypothetical protein
VDFLQRLLDGVVHFRHFDFGDYVEAVVGHRLFALPFGGFGLRRADI